MKKTTFWLDALKYGAIIGAMLAVSAMVEMKMLFLGHMGLYAVEWLLLVVAHYYLLHRFTRDRSRLYTAEEGFSFGQGYGFLLSMSLVSGIIVGLVQYVYLHLIIGYATYAERMMNAVTEMLSSNGAMNSQMESIFSQAMSQIESASEPSLLATVWSGVLSSVLFGAIFGLIIAGVQARSARPFDSAEDSATPTDHE